jgi:hypothetical protein
MTLRYISFLVIILTIISFIPTIVSLFYSYGPLTTNNEIKMLDINGCKTFLAENYPSNNNHTCNDINVLRTITLVLNIGAIIFYITVIVFVVAYNMFEYYVCVGYFLALFLIILYLTLATCVSCLLAYVEINNVMSLPHDFIFFKVSMIITMCSNITLVVSIFIFIMSFLIYAYIKAKPRGIVIYNNL